jgi:hypothetical protein
MPMNDNSGGGRGAIADVWALDHPFQIDFQTKYKFLYFAETSLTIGSGCGPWRSIFFSPKDGQDFMN